MKAELGWSRKALVGFGLVPLGITLIGVVQLLLIWGGHVKANEADKALFGWFAVFGFAVTASISVFLYRTRGNPTDLYHVGRALKDSFCGSWWLLPLSIAALFFTHSEFIRGIDLGHGVAVFEVSSACSFLETLSRHRIPAPPAAASPVSPSPTGN